MRHPRLKPKGQANVFHCISRTAGGLRLFGDPEREMFRKLLWHHAAFCQVQIVTHTMLSNHFHIVVRTPVKVNLSDSQLLAALQSFYGPDSAQVKAFKIALKKKKEEPQRLKALRKRYHRRMGDVSLFMKELKQAFSRWFNKRHDRFGTLWAERFTSLLVQDQSLALWVVAGYVDLNGLRAGMTRDPKEYRFCGYAEAVAGQKRAREGLLTLMPPGCTWKKFQGAYRKFLFLEAGKPGHSGKMQLEREEIEKVLQAGGGLNIAQLLRLRVRYLTAGVILGSQEFVEATWKKHCRKRSPKRQSGARKMKGGDWQGVMSMRDLQKDVIG